MVLITIVIGAFVNQPTYNWGGPTLYNWWWSCEIPGGSWQHCQPHRWGRVTSTSDRRWAPPELGVGNLATLHRFESFWYPYVFFVYMSMAISGTDLLEVPTICKAYFLGLCKGIYPKIWPYMAQYLHFRILEFPLNMCYAYNYNMY